MPIKVYEISEMLFREISPFYNDIDKQLLIKINFLIEVSKTLGIRFNLVTESNRLVLKLADPANAFLMDKVNKLGFSILNKEILLYEPK